jgi:hypothetical protein
MSANPPSQTNGASLRRTYDRIGSGYAAKRLSDERLARRIRAALGAAGTIVNVGAGARCGRPSPAWRQAT